MKNNESTEHVFDVFRKVMRNATELDVFGRLVISRKELMDDDRVMTWAKQKTLLVLYPEKPVQYKYGQTYIDNLRNKLEKTGVFEKYMTPDGKIVRGKFIVLKEIPHDYTVRQLYKDYEESLTRRK